MSRDSYGATEWSQALAVSSKTRDTECSAFRVFVGTFNIQQRSVAPLLSRLIDDYSSTGAAGPSPATPRRRRAVNMPPLALETGAKAPKPGALGRSR